MTENQIDYIIGNHKKYLSVFCGVTEQAVFKWGQRGKMPDKYLKALQSADVEYFIDRIKNHEIMLLDAKIEAVKAAVAGAL